MTGFVDQDREADVDRQIGEAYTRQPQEDLLGAKATARVMVALEPWDQHPDEAGAR